MCFVWISEQSDYFPAQHELIAFYNREGVCLLRGRIKCVCVCMYVHIYIYIYTHTHTHTHTTRFNIHKSYVLPTQCIYVFCMDLRTNSDYSPVQH
jgi:hypothetical protein